MIYDIYELATVIIQGFIVGVVVSAPVGPIGFLCINRTINYGALSGLFSAIGATIADTTYALIAAFGIGFITIILEKNPTEIRIAGSIILIIMAYKTYKKKTELTTLNKNEKRSAKSLITDTISTALLTLLNPLTLFAFLAIFAGMSKPFSSPYLTFVLICSVALGAFTWWLSLVLVITAIRHNISTKALKNINTVSAILILLLAIFAICSIIYSYFK